MSSRSLFYKRCTPINSLVFVILPFIKMKGWMFGIAVKMPLRIPAARVVGWVPVPAPAPESSLLLMQTMGDSSGGLGRVPATHMGRRDWGVPGYRLAWPSPGCWGHLEGEPMDGRSVLCVCLSNKSSKQKCMCPRKYLWLNSLPVFWLITRQVAHKSVV